MKISLKLIYLLNLWLASYQSSTGMPLGQFKELVTLTLFSRSKSCMKDIS